MTSSTIEWHPNDHAIRAVVGLGIALGLCWTLSWYIVYTLSRKRDDQFDFNERIRCSFSNIITLLQLLDCYQLSAVSLTPDVPWWTGAPTSQSQNEETSNSPDSNSIFDWVDAVRFTILDFQVEYGELIHVILFWTVAGWIVFLMCSAIFGSFICPKNTTRGRLFTPVWFLISLTGGILALPIFRVLFFGLSCTYEDERVFLDIYPSMDCWQDYHWGYVFASLVGLLCIYFLSIVYNNSQQAHDSGNICVRSWWLVARLQIKIITVAFDVFLAGRYSFISIIIVMVASIILTILAYLPSVKPSNNTFFNSLNRLVYPIPFLVSVCALVTVFVNDSGNWIPFCLMISLIVLRIIAWRCCGIVRLRGPRPQVTYKKSKCWPCCCCLCCCCCETRTVAPGDPGAQVIRSDGNVQYQKHHDTYPNNKVVEMAEFSENADNLSENILDALP